MHNSLYNQIVHNHGIRGGTVGGAGRATAPGPRALSPASLSRRAPLCLDRAPPLLIAQISKDSGSGERRALVFKIETHQNLFEEHNGSG